MLAVTQGKVPEPKRKLDRRKGSKTYGWILLCSSSGPCLFCCPRSFMLEFLFSGSNARLRFKNHDPGFLVGGLPN